MRRIFQRTYVARPVRLGLWLTVLAVTGALWNVGALSAQQGTVTGTVVESKSLKPLAGAQVAVQGQGRGSLTDINGRFRVTGVTGAQVTIDVVLLGYRPRSLPVTVGAADIRVPLDEMALELNEIVVTGTAGGVQKRSLGNSVAKVNASEIVSVAPVKSIQDLLNGRAAGVVVMPGTGMVGSGSRIRIRGLSTLSLSSDPLIYVDGIRVNNETGTGFAIQAFGSGVVSRLNDFNPEEIESLEILKGPAAATLYGTEAARGVINIITKKGIPGGARFTFEVKQGANWFMDPEGRMPTNYWRNPANNEVVGLNLVASENERGTPIFRTGHVQGYTGSVAGGSQEVRYFVSGDMDGEQGAERNNYRDRVSARANLQLNPHEKFDIQTSVGYVKTEVGLSCEAGCGGAMWGAVFGSAGRTSEACTPTSAYGCGFSRGMTSWSPDAYYAFSDHQFIDRMTASVQFNYRPFAWLANRFNVGTDITDETNTELWPYATNDTIRFFWGANIANGFKAHGRRHQTFNTFDYSASANFGVRPDVNSNTSVGVQYYQRHIESVYSQGYEFAAPGLTVVDATARDKTTSEDFLDNNTLGLFAQEQISWKDRLFLTGAVRVDNNSAFGADINWVTYPKAMLAWVLNEEPFFREKLPALLNTFKLRVAYGESGVQPASFAALRTYSPTPGPNNAAGVTPGSLGNPQLKPERGKEIELGFDAGAFNDRLAVEFTYYNTHTHDAILLKSVAPSSGFTGSQWVNAGEIANSGIELTVRGTLLQTRTLAWDLTFNMGTNSNKVVDLGGDQFIASGRTRNQVGYAVNGWWLQKIVSAERSATGTTVPASLMCQGSPTVGNGAPVACLTGTSVSAPFVFMGRVTPSNEGSLTSTWRLWQRLRITAMLDWQVGHYKFNNNTRARCSVFFVCRENVLPAEYDARVIAAYERGTSIQGEFVEKANFAKLREVSVGYDVPESYASRIGARGVSINFAARNLHTFTKYTGLDPENMFLSGTPGFLEQDNLPQLAQIITTFRVSF